MEAQFTIELQRNGAGWWKWMKMRWLIGRVHHFNLPGGWKELTTAQFLKIAMLMRKGLPAKETEILAVYGLSGLPKFAYFLLKAEDVYIHLVPRIKWLYEPISLKISHLKTMCKHYHGHLGKLKGLSWKQYMLAEIMVKQYAETRSIDALRKLAAVIFCSRMSEPPKDVLAFELRQEEMEKRYELFKRVPVDVLFVAYLNYVGNRNALMEEFDNLKPKPGQAKAAGQPDFHKLMLELSNGPFGDYEKTELEPVENVLKLLDVQLGEKPSNPVNND
jgi:hypothetical protein